MIITLVGDPCSGKSTVGRILAEQLGFKHYSIGDLRRKFATERSMTLAELNKKGETEDTDTAFDKYQEELGKQEDNFVIDGRLSAHFIPHAKKVYLIANEEERARRFLTDEGRDKRGELATSLEEAKKLMRERVQSDKKRYLQHYNFDPYNPELYDIVIDTSNIPPEQVVQEIREAI